jgi:ubiquitin C-terminal hydrolase
MILKTFENKNELLLEYQNIVKLFWTSSESSINILKLLKLFINKFSQFNNNNQNDSQEVFICFLDFLDNSIDTFIKKIFFSELEQTTVCKNNSSLKKEFTNIHFLYPTEETSLTKLIIKYQDWNTIENYEDNNGMKHCVALTRTIIKEPSPILIFSFKMYNKKIKIELEENIKINKFDYNLFAMVTHIGSTQGGHYISYTKHKNIWYMKDDEVCEKVSTIPLKHYHYLALYKKL